MLSLKNFTFLDSVVFVKFITGAGNTNTGRSGLIVYIYIIRNLFRLIFKIGFLNGGSLCTYCMLIESNGP